MKDDRLEVVVNGVRYVREDLSDSPERQQRIYELGKKEGREELQEELRNFLGLEI